MKTRIMGLLTMLCTLCGCSTVHSGGFKSLTVEEYAKAIEDSTIVRLDVRTAEEYAEGHIANTINIDVLKEGFIEKVQAYISSLPIKGESEGWGGKNHSPYKGETEGVLIAVNCRGGKRSKNAAGILVKNGFRVIELDAGYNEWVAKGMPVAK